MRVFIHRFVTVGLGLTALAAACNRGDGPANQREWSGSIAPAVPPTPQFASVTEAMLLSAGSDPTNAENWLTYGGSYSNQRYSPLNQVSRENVKNLALAWTY